MNQRLRIALIVSLFFAVPAVLTLALITSDYSREIKRGPQPGGTIRGLVVGPGKQPIAGAAVDLFLDPTHADASAEVSQAHAVSDAHGAFELHAPPLDGRYNIVAGGGAWQRAAKLFSFVGEAKGDAKDAPRTLTLELRPGCELRVEFVRDDGLAVADGVFDLEGQGPGGFLIGFVQPPLRRQGSVEHGQLYLDALPPMNARLHVRFDTGERIELALPLEAGTTRRTIRL